MADLTGQNLGRYRLEAPLGRGGMAAVYRAFDSELRRAVAVKVILSEFVTDDSFLKRFRQEAELVAHLDHPNILPVFDFGDDRGRLYLVMPLREEGSLENRMHGPVAPGLALNYISQLAEALDAAHGAGILHRDVKPANVLLGKDDHVYLSDFGIAKMLESQKGLTATGMVVGTPTYMAPEQAAGKPAGPASDRYALAVMAFELLAGMPPFRGESALSVLHQHVTAPVPPISRSVPGLPLSVDGVLRKALSKEPSERHSTCREFARQLSSSVSGQLHAVAVAASPRTAPLPPEAGTEALDIPKRVPAVAVPSPRTPRPSAVLTGAPTVAARSASASTARRLWPLGVAGAVAAGVVLIIFVGSRDSGKSGSTVPAGISNAASPVPSIEPAAAPHSGPLIENPKVPGNEPPGRAEAPGPPPIPAPPEAFPPATGPGAVLRAWKTMEPQHRHGQRPDQAEFERLLSTARQALQEAPASPAALALEQYAQGGLAYLSGDLAMARSKLDRLRREGPVRELRDLPRAGEEVPDWALALVYLDPRREASGLLEKAERRGDPGAGRGRRMLDRLEGEDRGPGGGFRDGRPGAQPPPADPPGRGAFPRPRVPEEGD